MKKYYYIFGLFALLLWMTGCEKTEQALPADPETPAGEVEDIPEGYFIATFSGLQPDTKAPISGPDTRIQHIRYIVYKSTGEFVKERILLTNGTTTTWPFQPVRDTLPRGSYKAVFLGNVDSTLFSYATPKVPNNYSSVLKNYKVNYNNARIYLPNAEFKDNSEYYWANVDFSDETPTPTVTLQRIIGMMNVHRNFVDSQRALDSLLSSIEQTLHYRDLIKNTTTTLLKPALQSAILGATTENIIELLGGIDLIVNPLLAKLVQPVADTLYNRFTKQLVHQLGNSLAGNENQGNNALGLLGELLNPWKSGDAHTAIVTINNFPKSINFNLAVQERYTGLDSFAYNFVNDAFFAEKCIYIKNFSGLFDIRRIHIVKQGLISGVLIDRVIDGPLLLKGTFVDINTPLTYTPGTNRRYKADYSFIDIGLKSYQQPAGNTQTVSVKLLEIANLHNILASIPILGTPIPILLPDGLLRLVSTPISNIKIQVTLPLPILTSNNLSLTGGWDTPVAY